MGNSYLPTFRYVISHKICVPYFTTFAQKNIPTKARNSITPPALIAMPVVYTLQYYLLRNVYYWVKKGTVSTILVAGGVDADMGR